MSSSSTKIVFACFVLLAAPGVSFARMAGEAGAGNRPISGVPSGPGNPGGINNVLTDPSGVENAAKVPPVPPPHITVPVIPQFK